MNLKLRYAIDKARSVSMPKDNIEKAIKRGTGELEGASYDEIIYEGYGPGGVAVLVEVLTDNRNRTNGEIQKIFERAGANVGVPGSVAYMFDRKGFFAVDAAKYPDEDALMTVALDAGAEDMQREGDVFEITCDPSNFSAVLEALKAANIETTEAEVKYLSKMQKDLDVETGQESRPVHRSARRPRRRAERLHRRQPHAGDGGGVVATPYGPLSFLHDLPPNHAGGVSLRRR